MRVHGITALLAGLCVLATLGCGDTQRDDGRFRVGLLTPGSIRDGGWNQSAYEGLERIRDELGAEIAHQETQTPQDFEAGFRDFAARGFDLVFGHGFEFQDAAARVGAEYPDTVFVTTSGNTTRPNVAPIVFELEQATFALGYLGARLSRRARVGMIGGVKIPSVASTFEAFAAGAQYARKNAVATPTYIGSWSDVAAAREATLAQISEGTDVLIHNCNEAARGFFQAVEESDGVYAFGTNKNQNDQAPKSVLGSAVLDVPRALLLVAEEVHAGSFLSRSMRFGLRSGVVSIEWNEALRPAIPDTVWKDTLELIEQIRVGAVSVPRGSF